MRSSPHHCSCTEPEKTDANARKNSISEVAGNCGAGRKLVEQYFYILEDLLLAHRLPVFTKRAKRRFVNHPKFYFFDSGVYRAIRPKGPLDRPGKIDGMTLETLVFQ